MHQKPLIGVDLDNTLACYDGLFHNAGLEEGLINEETPASKERIRDSIRLLPDGEQLWMRLQAIVYGPRMYQAKLFEGASDFLKSCAVNQVRAVIVSHKTPTARLDGKEVDERLMYPAMRIMALRVEEAAEGNDRVCDLLFERPLLGMQPRQLGLGSGERR